MTNKSGMEKVVGTLHKELYEKYQRYHIPELGHLKIKRKDIEPLIEELTKLSKADISVAGLSVEGRKINLIKIGAGPSKILFWSQMHGDEATATRALFEILRFFTSSDDLDGWKEQILRQVTLLFVPMLNPDGAEVFKRQNALDIDLNRDALRQVSPEAKILKSLCDRYRPEFGFNLHDQSIYYNVRGSSRPAAISFLAPAFNAEKEIDIVRENAMKLIISMNEVLQQYIPGHVGRFNDDFEPRAFGDNIQKWGISTVLIESGGYPKDPEKKEVVKMNFIAILHALEEISRRGYETRMLAEYLKIPENDRKLFDLIIRNAEVEKSGGIYKVDVGILIQEENLNGDTMEYRKATIEEIGDLSGFYGYEELDARGMRIKAGKIVPEVLKDDGEMGEKEALQYLREGYVAARVEQMVPEQYLYKMPLFLMNSDEQSLPGIVLGAHANFTICSNDQVVYAIVNGRIIAVH